MTEKNRLIREWLEKFNVFYDESIRKCRLFHTETWFYGASPSSPGSWRLQARSEMWTQHLPQRHQSFFLSRETVSLTSVESPESAACLRYLRSHSRRPMIHRQLPQISSSFLRGPSSTSIGENRLF